MKLNDYSSIDWKNKELLGGEIPFLFRHFEHFLLCLVALLGLLGSVYVFSDKSADNQGSFSELSLSSFTLEAPATLPFTTQSDFHKYIALSGSEADNKTLHFELLLDYKSSRYILELGNGVRMILTAKVFDYTYDTPGNYTMELKEIKNGLLNTISTYEFKIEENKAYTMK